MKKLFLITSLLFCSISYGQGCISGDCSSGQGTYIFANGDKYVGSFKDGKITGQGAYNYSNRTRYVGSFKDNKRNGQGTYTFANGDVKEGIWENDRYIGTQDQINARDRERERIQNARDRERERIKKESIERQAREEEKKKYDKIYNACLLEKSSGIDMQVSSLSRAVEDTCKSIAENPSWLDNWKYN